MDYEKDIKQTETDDSLEPIKNKRETNTNYQSQHRIRKCLSNSWRHHSNSKKVCQEILQFPKTVKKKEIQNLKYPVMIPFIHSGPATLAFLFSSFHFSNETSMFLPQDLFTGFSLCLEHSLPRSLSPQILFKSF